MSNFYFFSKDGACKWMKKEIFENFSKYLHEPIEYNGKSVKFNMILSWIKTSTRGANQEWLDELGINYVETINDLKDGDGIYITGYDSDVLELEEAKRRNIPIIENPCPWVKELKKQLLSVNKNTHQCVLMIDADHMVYNCYKAIFPEDIIIVQAENYENILNESIIKKPIHLLIYAAHRKKDAQNIEQFITAKYPSENNILDGYKKSICCWSNQGVFEEIEDVSKKQNLEEIWIVCSSEGDRSTISIINQVIDCGLKPVLIKKETDIPKGVDENRRIGVVLAPIPLSEKKRGLVNVIRRLYGDNKEVIRSLYESFVALLLECEESKIEARIDEIMFFLDDDAKWIMNGDISVVSIAGEYNGKEEIRKFFRTFKKDIKSKNVDVDEDFIVDGNKIVTLLHEDSLIKTTGKECGYDVCHIWKLNDNKKIVYFRSFNDSHALYEGFKK